MTSNSNLESKIRKARLIILAEKLWLRLWILFVLVSVFLAVSFADIWTNLNPFSHKVLIGTFAFFGLVWLIFMVRTPWPTRKEGIDRIERISGIPHRPATSYEDTLQSSSNNSQSKIIWKEHKKRMAALIAKLRFGLPAPRTDRYDPFALRTLIFFFIVIGAVWFGRSGLSLLSQAVQIEKTSQSSELRIDAWVSPPSYTARPPIMLFDGSGKTTSLHSFSDETEKNNSQFEIPEKSTLVVRESATKNSQLILEIRGKDSVNSPEVVKSPPKDSGGDVLSEVRYDLMQDSDVNVLLGGKKIASWVFKVIPDNNPGIALTKNPERTSRGAIKLTYFVQDDYGVSSAEVVFTRVHDETKNENSMPWSQPQKPESGPRPPYTHPPKLPLRLPGPNVKQGEAFTYHEIGSHPWAGQRVKMVLQATDVAGKTGKSPLTEIVLPERSFTKPLARALIEQRKLLIEDPRYSEHVHKALEAFTIDPEGFIDDIRVYFPLRTTMYRLRNDKGRSSIDSAIEQLWHSALRIEEGDLSDAEKNLRDIQDKLAKALEEGASDEEIQKLMRELRDAFKDYANKMQEEKLREKNEKDLTQRNEEEENLSTEDLDRMMREMEELANNGMREKAKDLLAEIQDLMERMEKGQQNAERQKQNQQMKEAIKKLGEAVGEQQDIMDDTFEENRQQQEGRTGEKMRQTQSGQKGKRGQGMQADRGGSSSDQGNDDGEMGLRERGSDSDGEGTAKGQERRRKLAQRQAELRKRLDEMQKNMQQKGLSEDQKLQEASEAMQQAEEALLEDNLEQANAEQSRALDKMRESGQQMAEQLQQNGEQRNGQNGENSRDPMGRPQRFQGADQGRSVKVPDQIEIQRAREVLEELRRRAGEPTRPKIELDYIDRLLRWY
ncbi:MAG: TIGR02302 family protein [Hyphomicrobium sp.]